MNQFPELIKLQEKFRNKSLLEYVNEHLMKERELLPLDEDAYKIFSKNFKQQNIRRIATGSHMAFLQWETPFGLSENILTNLLNILEVSGSTSTPIIPCSRITFQNFTKPGMINLSGMNENNIRLSRYFLRGQSKITFDKAKKITKQEIEDFLFMFYKFQRNPSKMFSFIESNSLSLFIKFAKQAINTGKSFKEQSKWFSSLLWPHLFKDFKVASLILKPMEDLQVKRENLLVNKKMRQFLEKYFKDSYGALSSTYFYYGSCKCGREFPLVKKENGDIVYLEGNCIDESCPYFGRKKYKVDVNDILEEVDKKNLHETLFISFYNVWVLAGIDVLGGFNQIHYLKEFRNKLCLIFDQMGEYKKSKILRERATNLLSLGMLVAFNKNGIPKSGSQIFLEGGLTKEYIRQYSKLNFSKTADISLQIIKNLLEKKFNRATTLEVLKKQNVMFLVS